MVPRGVGTGTDTGRTQTAQGHRLGGHGHRDGRLRRRTVTMEILSALARHVLALLAENREADGLVRHLGFFPLL